MPEYLHPGVYIEEILGPQPIQGVSTSTTGMVGVTQRGPTEGKPVLVTSFADFRQQFGGYLEEPDDAERSRWELNDQEGGYWWRFPLAVQGFFDNGGLRLYVKRVVSSQATAAFVTVPASAIEPRPANVTQDPLRLVALAAPAPPAGAPPDLLQVVAKAKGDWGSDISVRVRPARATRIQAVSSQGTGPLATTLAATLAQGDTSAVLSWPDRLGTVAGPVIVQVASARFTVATVPAAANRKVTLTLPQASPARWSSGTPVKIFRAVDQPVAGAAGQLTVPLALTADDAVYPGALVLVGPAEARATVSVVTPPPAVQPAAGPRLPGSVTLTAVTAAGFPRVFESDVVQVIEAAVDVRYKPGASNPASRIDQPETTETFPGLRVDQLAGTPRSIVDVINADSNLVSLEKLDTPAGTAVGWNLFPGGPSDDDDGYLPLSGGDDQLSALEPQDFVGEDGGSGHRTGIQALEDIEDIAICAVPGIWARSVQSALIAHCQLLRDRFAVLDPQQGLGIQEMLAFRSPLDSDYAALYYPWVKVPDPANSDQQISMPPSGHMTGVYALVDTERGVHKAPANVVIQAITGLDADVNEREQDVLNPVGINALRSFPNRGLRVWGARTISSIPEWRYVNVRRLFIYVEDSIKQGTQWVVFEPNAEPLWALVTQAITNFLDTVWRTGALEGTKQEEAFFVRCDRSTMTEDDIANGRLIVEIGIAPVKPAEFVIFRFRQKTLSQTAPALAAG
jgi:hypothetical protein